MGDNLFLNLDISLEEALLGFSRTIRHLDGHEVTIAQKPMTVSQPFSWIVLPEEGMPKRGTGEFGELHVKLIVTMPKKLSNKQKELAARIFTE